MAINFLSVLGTVVCPYLLLPQAKTEPSSNKANEWKPPALIVALPLDIWCIDFHKRNSASFNSVLSGK